MKDWDTARLLRKYSHKQTHSIPIDKIKSVGPTEKTEKPNERARSRTHEMPFDDLNNSLGAEREKKKAHTHIMHALG